MRRFTELRTASTVDEIWITEHDPVYTLGQNTSYDHILTANGIPIVVTDRGGQVTYHGPGQLVVYVLFDLARMRINVHQLVNSLEQSMIDALAKWGIEAGRIPGNPGVYVCNNKVGALGLRIKRHRAYHGISLNISMDLMPFLDINPCGMIGMEVRQVSDYCGINEVSKAAGPVVDELCSNFRFKDIERTRDNLGLDLV